MHGQQNIKKIYCCVRLSTYNFFIVVHQTQRHVLYKKKNHDDVFMARDKTSNKIAPSPVVFSSFYTIRHRTDLTLYVSVV